MQYTFTRPLKSNDEHSLLVMLDTYAISAYFETPNQDKKLFAYGAEKISNDFNNINGEIIFGGQQFNQTYFKDSVLMNGFWFLPTIYVELTESSLTFHSETINDFDSWLIKTKQLLKQQVSILNTQDEEDWPTRTQMLITDLNSDEEVKKVVFGRQRQNQLSRPLYAANLIMALSVQQNTYHVVLKNQNELFVSATPERLVKVSSGYLETAALAGTINRGLTPSEDQLLGESLLSSVKNRQEHTYVVHELKQKLQTMTTCLDVPETPILLKNKQVQHLYTPINGKLAQYGITDIMTALHPTPALGGVPKALALAYINAHEKQPRGLFASPIGYYTGSGDGEFAVGIRSMLINQTTRIATLFAGAGIVADSIAEEEYEETGLKFEPMQQLLKDYNHGE